MWGMLTACQHSLLGDWELSGSLLCFLSHPNHQLTCDTVQCHTFALTMRVSVIYAPHCVPLK